jgi:cob(I)alamin adenosyltransferase
MIQVYTGCGKGKTTAALGAALRASGAGLKVYICQFLKGKYYCELAALKKIKSIKVEQFGTKCFVGRKPSTKDIELAKLGLKSALKAIKSNCYDLVILDEVNIAIKLGLLGLEDVLNVIEKAPKRTELILTGRYAHPKIIKISDLASEIKEIKHYYNKGVKARKGIEF